MSGPDLICGCFHWRSNMRPDGRCELCGHGYPETDGMCEVPQTFDGRHFVDKLPADNDGAGTDQE
jgi:hypothetical protein